MKHIVSVSLGSSSRDHKVEKEILGENFLIERRGTDGDFNKACRLYTELDGKVDAIGMGGISLYITTGEKKYYFRDAKKLIANMRETPVVDGSGLKDTLERKVVEFMDSELNLDLASKKVLAVCCVERLGMAEAFIESGADIIFGDVIFALGLPIPIRTMKNLRRLTKTIAPIVTRLPFSMVYPVGKAQDKESKRLHNRYYEQVDIIAGDYHYIKKNFPQRLDGKIIVTNTVTEKDAEKLKDLGIKMLITTSPDLGGRSFGTNVIEAVLVAYLRGKGMEPGIENYAEALEQLGFTPRVVNFA